MIRKSVRDVTDEEEARIQAGIAADPDNPEMTAEQMAELRPFREVCPDLMATIRRSRGRPRVDAPKQAVTLRLSPETIARFKAIAGADWRRRMSEELEAAAKLGRPITPAP